MNIRMIEEISDFIFMEDSIEKADVIFLPGCTYSAQAEFAAGLFQKGYADYLIPSGKFAMKLSKFSGGQGKNTSFKEYQTECEFFSSILKRNGVPDGRIMKETEARFTRQNAEFTRELLAKKGVSISSAILVCRAFHARRAFMYYAMAFPGVKIMVQPVSTIGITKENWFLSKKGVELVLGELAKCGEQTTEDVKEYLSLK